MNLKDEAIIFLIRHMWKYSLGRRKWVIIYLLFITIANIITFFQPLILAHIINIIQLEGVSQENIGRILLWVASMIGLVLGFWLFHGVGRIIEMKNAFLVRYDYNKHLFTGLLSLPMKWHDENQSGDIIDKFQKSSSGIYNFSSSSFMIFQTIISFIGSVVAIIYLNNSAILFILIGILISFSVTIYFNTILKNQYSQLYKYQNSISAKVYDSISNITTILILRIEKLISKNILNSMMKPYDLFKKNIKINELKWFLVSINAGFITSIVIGSYIYLSYKNADIILIGTISALFIYVERLNGVFFQFAWQYEQLVREKTQIENAHSITKKFKEKKINRLNKLNSNWQKIEFRNISFKYDEDKSVGQLKKINFSIIKREKIAIVGESGSGKTTLLKILRGLFKPNFGEIIVDSKLIKNGFRKVNDKTMLIPQEPEIFATSIKENITMGIPHKISYLKKFTNLATFTKVLNKLPNNWESNINEKGVNLSGGEKQRLALSRALLAASGKEILLMDESTSSVDSMNELKIYKGVFREFKDKTIIATIHKYNLLPLFDKIIFMKKGKIIKQGTLDELTRDSIEFRNLLKKYKNLK